MNGSGDTPKPVRAAVATAPAERQAPKLAPDTSRAPTSPTNGTLNPQRAPSQVYGGRRTPTIRGHGAERNLPLARPALRRHERPGFRPDRAALWAVILGLVLILVAAASAHAAMLH